MDAAAWQLAKEIIAEALKRQASERPAFVRARCSDPQLASEITALLTNYTNESDFLNQPPPLDDLDGDSDDLEPGTRVGPYVIVDTIGRGGMGQVFLGSDPRLRRKVALKCVLRSLAGSGERRLRILHEARAAARVTHPNVATIHDVVEHDGAAFIVMEYVEGESLSARMRRERLPIERVIDIGRQLASALGAAHAKGVVHRDLKPANIHVGPDGFVKVLDFGIANAGRSIRTVGTSMSTGRTVAQPATRTPQPGTPPYMSPEQLLGRPVDERSDLYSLGVVLFEMATGRRPFRETEAEDLILAVTRGAPRADAEDKAVPRALADVIAKALEPDCNARFQSAVEIGTALNALQRRGDRPEPLRKLAARVAVGMVTVPIVLGSVGFIATSGFNLTFGRTGDFGKEPFLMYFIWGQRALLPSVFDMTAAVVVVLGGQFALRVIELVGPIGRLMKRLRSAGRTLAARVGLDRPAGLAQALTALAVVALGAMVAYHADLMRAWGSFINTAPASNMLPLRPDNLERLWYRGELDLLILAFGFGLFRAIRLQRRQRTNDGTAPIALLAAVIAIMFLLNEFPYRILVNRDTERVEYGGVRCQIIGESADEFLIFCPQTDPPRNRTIRRDDAKLRRLGIIEPAYAGVTVSHQDP
ncbi:MAG: hypothetical protein DMG00_12000 [Acidobacteria bacterium]|nr:MAG: hypothetical protein DMG00_12000 [Acidobacteriota bacterium]